MDHRSPLESIFSIIGGLPQGHDKPVKHAVYNAVALFLLFLCCGAGWALFLILEPFIKPLMWAVLVGSALHPLKRSLRMTFQSWFKTLEVKNTPVILGVFLLPVNFIDYLSEFIGNNLLKRLRLIIAVCVAIPVIHVIYYYTPNIITVIVSNLIVTFFGFLNFFLNNSTLTVVLFITIAYVSLVYLLWRPENNTKFHYASIGIWLIGSCCLAQQFGSYQLIVFIILQTIFFGGFIWEIYEVYTEMNLTETPVSFNKAISIVFHGKLPYNEVPLEENDSQAEMENIENDIKRIEKSEKNSPNDATEAKQEDPFALSLFEKKAMQTSPANLTKVSKSEPKLLRSMSQPHVYSPKHKVTLTNNRKLSLKNSNQTLIDSENYESTFYLYSVLWACIVMLFWKNVMLLPLLPIPLLCYVIKHVGIYLGMWQWINLKFIDIMEVVRGWCSKRHDALVPVPIRGIYRIMDKLNEAIKSGIKGSIDTVASFVVIFALIVFVISASIFFVLQIYAEAIMMVQMTSNVINQTVVHNPELRQLLPPAWDDTVDSILDNAYQYGREGISKGVRSILSDVETSKSEKLEKQVLELWDRVYQNWMSSENTGGPKVTEDAVRSSWENFINDIQKSPEMFNINGIVDFAKQNVGTLISLLESVWSIVKGNISLILGSFSTFLSVILGGGTAVLNFILSVIVFLTTLFYLLSSSGDLYKPVEILTNFSQSGRRFGHALEGAINGVFLASFKMAAFYGLWTWLIHNLFSVKIVYLPSAIATILGAVPFLGTYWACCPAVLDLWLAQDRGVEAILFAGFQFLPTSIVDTTIYKEIKGGGHPYLTGLAIAGGIFCLGVEGAIIGPLLLCGLYVVIDLSSTLFKESPTEEELNLRYQLQDSELL
ncbi:transmembrane protein 245 isoform X2 [Aethina tumida]|uniref:transmembrane protein 245 isoform X2 n=1 Tax=Aethina tumida TaxID=116153 RepID=UPI00096AFD7F|nr:transmembrane protein 245 isoform X2 [Aethina tumida]